MTTYLWSMAAGSVVILGLYGLRCALAVREPRLKRAPWLTALLSLIFGAAFGLVLARMSYALLMQELDFEYDGIEALYQLLELSVTRMSFFGGAAGVLLGVLLANRLTRKGAITAGLDAFAPFGALLVALFRMGELAYGSYGLGTSLAEDSPFAFFPFAVQVKVDGGYSYWGWAICVLSAAFALVWAAVALLRFRRGRTGLCFTLTLFYLALPQVLCESLRNRPMLWLFVRPEQVLCAVIMFAVLLVWLLKSGRGMKPLRRWAPMAGLLVCVGLVVATEFAIDGKLFDLPHTVCYAFMIAVLAVMGVCGAVAAKRWSSEA